MPTGSDVGRVLKSLHKPSEDSYELGSTWIEFLSASTNRYFNNLTSESKAELAPYLHAHLCSLKGLHLQEEPRLGHFDFRLGNILIHQGQISGVIDFESMRVAHPSMDFIKLWFSAGFHFDGWLAPLLKGYGNRDWIEALPQLLSSYRVYHGLAGLSWCCKRAEFDSPFFKENLGHLKSIQL